MNIDHPSQIHQCTSCQMCGAVCPTGAISISLDADGFYRPFVDFSACIDCGLCVKSCYKFDDSIVRTDLSTKKIYAAWANDEEIVDNTTSGGIADLLAKKLVADGYRCIGVAYDAENNRAVGSIADKESDVLKFRGSKYIQSLSVDSFKILVKNHKTERFAVFGLPCQIYAIDRFLKMRGSRDSHILIDLYCHGCPSLNVWTKYIDATVNKTGGGKIQSANFRSKFRGWGNFCVSLSVENGKSTTVDVVSPRINDGFYELFFSDLILNGSCADCLLRSTLEYTDIRLGDFWGKAYVNNRTGVSGITVSSHRGAALLDKIRSDISILQQAFENFMPYQSYGKTYHVDTSARNRLLALLSDGRTSIEECVSAYHRMLPFKSRMKHDLKNMVKLLPDNVVAYIKSFIYSLKNSCSL